MKSPSSCFPSHFCFLVIFVLLVQFLLFLVAVFSLPPRNFYIIFLWSYRCIDAILNTCKSSSFFSWNSLSTSSRECKALCIVIGFLVLSFICEVLHTSTLRMVPSILRGGQPRYLSLRWNFCYVVWSQVVFFVIHGYLKKTFFHLCIFDGVCFISFLFSDRSDFFFDLVVLFLPSFAAFRLSL